MTDIKEFLMPYPKKIEQKEGEVKVDGIKITGFSCDCDLYKTAVEYLSVFGEGGYTVEIEIFSILPRRRQLSRLMTARVSFTRLLL